jgi:anti-sigma regulatory factor (Ser/Thr protein kinase)
MNAAPPFEARYVEALPPHSASVSDARRRAVNFLDDQGLDPTTVAEMAVIVSELVANAVEATSGDDLVTVTVAVDGDVSVEVTNHAPRVGAPTAQTDDDALRERGRGLLIVEALADRFESIVHGEQVTVRASLSFG